MEKRKLHFLTLLLFGFLFASLLSPACAMQYETEPNNSQAQANTLTFGTPVQGQLASVSDSDWFKFTIPAASTINISFSVDFCAYNEYWQISIYDSSNIVLASFFNNEDCAHVDSWNIGTASGGTFYVSVKAAQSYIYHAEPYVLTISSSCIRPAAPSLTEPGGWKTPGQSYTVAWKSVAGATSYQVKESTSRTFTGATTCSKVLSKIFVRSPSAITTYYYRVRAVNSCGAGPWSNIVDMVIIP